ncbi:hypothetical protein [Methylomagnum ishizawai]|uniref:hypothetical protein n=1 Tax=Methylomagnum ishizawai TaxID=1760988 RepID=UPI000F743851|nr:hypothetical protein [Methylomagnum ishizawai]
MATQSTRTQRYLALVALAAALGGCATVATHGANGKPMTLSQEEFARYVERVFRHHNQVMNALIEAEDAEDAEDGALAAAEARMTEACDPLNEVVSESLSGASADLQTQMALIDAVPACEAATRIVEGLLPRAARHTSP